VDDGVEVAVRFHVDGAIEISLPPTEHPLELLRKAASVLERYAGSVERDLEPLRCEECGAAPTGVRAAPDGRLQFTPCGHGIP
jgi:hypothetical protein